MRQSYRPGNVAKVQRLRLLYRHSEPRLAIGGSRDCCESPGQSIRDQRAGTSAAVTNPRDMWIRFPPNSGSVCGAQVAISELRESMGRNLVLIAIFAACPLECMAETLDAPVGCRIAAAEMHLPRGRLLRRRAARIVRGEVASAAVVRVDEPAGAAEAGPTVVQGAASATPHLPAHDTDVWPPAWGLFPAAESTR